MTLADVAGDLGATPANARLNLDVLDPTLERVRNGVMERDDYTQVYVDALCILSVTSRLRAESSKIALRRADDAVGESDGRGVAAEAADVANSARVAATGGIPARAQRGIVAEALQEVIARGRDLRARVVAAALEARR